MPSATFWIAIVLAAGAGVALAALWMQVLMRARNAATDARTAADAARPMADALARIESQMREIEAQRQHAMGGLEAHLATLGKETLALSQALRGPNARGRWGELTLRRVAELAGMAPYCDFFEQQTPEQQAGDKKRPDMLVKLPGGRTLAVDAKAPLAAYLDAEEASDPASRAAALDRHAQQLWRHVQDLSTREYWAQFDPAPEMVVLFLPGEHFMSAALERNRDLLEAALAKKVLLATPVTLVSILKGVSYGWRQERLAKNAEELRRIAGEFHERVRAFAEYYADSGRHLSKAIEAYNRSVASWDARLLPSLKRMRELGVGGSAEPPQPARIDTAARQPELPESPGMNRPA
ncbi:MAG: DNA recombination protein RmuC [Acidobacteriia bacterium]|nr:DNA recombination protein RmuC [Terriglobia bacterium]